MRPVATRPGTSTSGTRRVTKSSPESNCTSCRGAQPVISTVWQVLVRMAGLAAVPPRSRGAPPTWPVSSRSSRTAVSSGEASAASITPPGTSSSTVFVPWRYCPTNTMLPSGVTALTLFRSGASYP